MFTLNMLLFVSSSLTLGYASYFLSSKWHLLTNNVIPIVMFILFGILMLVSLLGSLGTCRLSKLLLMTYSCLLILCFALQIAVIVLVIISSNDTTEKWLDDRWNDLSQDDKHWIENELECCGFNESVTDNICTNHNDYCEPSLKSYLKELRLIAIILGSASVIIEVTVTIIPYHHIHIIIKYSDGWCYSQLHIDSCIK